MTDRTEPFRRIATTTLSNIITPHACLHSEHHKCMDPWPLIYVNPSPRKIIMISFPSCYSTTDMLWQHEVDPGLYGCYRVPHYYWVPHILPRNQSTMHTCECLRGSPSTSAWNTRLTPPLMSSHVSPAWCEPCSRRAYPRHSQVVEMIPIHHPRSRADRDMTVPKHFEMVVGSAYLRFYYRIAYLLTSTTERNSVIWHLTRNDRRQTVAVHACMHDCLSRVHLNATEPRSYHQSVLVANHSSNWLNVKTNSQSNWLKVKNEPYIQHELNQRENTERFTQLTQRKKRTAYLTKSSWKTRTAQSNWLMQRKECATRNDWFC